MTNAHFGVGIAFLAGLVSFASPCVLPLVPAYLSYLTGSRLEELAATFDPRTRGRLIVLALGFIAGFTIVFVLLGASASAIGSLLLQNRRLIAEVGGVIIIVLGLQMIGVLRLRFLAMDTRPQVTRASGGSVGMSVVVGIAFAAGWSPCIGPILAGILALASQANGVRQGAWLLFVYSMGLAVPFLVTAAAIGVVLPALARIRRALPAIEIAAGVFMVLTGLVLVTNSFLRVAGFFYQFVPQPKI